MAMIINLDNKFIQSQSHRPQGANWMGDGWVPVPQELELLALSSSPYCELQFDGEGNLIGITPLDKPDPTPPPVEEDPYAEMAKAIREGVNEV